MSTATTSQVKQSRTRRGIRLGDIPQDSDSGQPVVNEDQPEKILFGEHTESDLHNIHNIHSDAKHKNDKGFSREHCQDATFTDVHQTFTDVHAEADEDPFAAATDPASEDLADAIKTMEDAISCCGDDPTVLAADAFVAAAALVRSRDQAEWYRLRVALKKAKPSGVLLSDIDRASRPEGDGDNDTTVADELIALVRAKGELFHSTDGECFVVLNDPPRQCFRLESQAFTEWLGWAFYRDTESESGQGRAASDTAIKTARVVLNGIARNDGDERPVFLRAAKHEGAYYIDMGDDQWRAIEITATGWRLIDSAPVHFYRAATTRPLPAPVPGGNLDKLWEFANIPEDHRDMVKAWMLEAWRPETPFPVLELVGQQGTAKSSTQAKIRRCIDPNAVDLRAAPKSVEDLFVSAGANWLASMNNLSHLSAGIQDAICNLATGGGFAGRTLYTNSDETLIEAKRPVVLNGIVPLVTAQDLTDRVIHVELPEIQDYRSESDIDAAFDEAAPDILGGLLDLFVLTLRHLPQAKIDRPPRMADFALLGEAMMMAQDHQPRAFLDAYLANRRNSIARSLEASPVAVAIRALADKTHESTSLLYDGLMKQLLDTLADYRDGAEAWPRSPRGLGDALRRQRPALAQIGIKITISKPGRDGVRVTIERATDAPGNVHTTKNGNSNENKEVF